MCKYVSNNASVFQSLQDFAIERTREPNFTVEDKNVLTKLVNKRKDVIENKAADTKSILKKKDAWLLIEKEFNRTINVYKRDHGVLKIAWDNIKAQTCRMQAVRRDVKKSKSPATLPLQKKTILRMVEEIACNNMNEKSQDAKNCLLSQKECENDANINMPAPEFKYEVKNELESDDNENIDSSMKQNDVVPMNDQTAHLETNHLSFHLEVESDDLFQIKTENNNGDDTIENIFTNIQNTTSNSSTQLEADLLNSLQSQQTYDVECNILKAKLQTALLEHQAAVINLEAVKLDLALKTKRLE